VEKWNFYIYLFYCTSCIDGYTIDTRLIRKDELDSNRKMFKRKQQSLSIDDAVLLDNILHINRCTCHYVLLVARRVVMQWHHIAHQYKDFVSYMYIRHCDKLNPQSSLAIRLCFCKRYGVCVRTLLYSRVSDTAAFAKRVSVWSFHRSTRVCSVFMWQVKDTHMLLASVWNSREHGRRCCILMVHRSRGIATIVDMIDNQDDGHASLVSITPRHHCIQRSSVV